MADEVLRRRVLDLGLEDDIPLWEVADDCRAAGAIASGTAGVEVLARALVELTQRDEIRIRIRVGAWDSTQTRGVERAEAERLLMDSRRYSFAEEIANGLERVYYVNVDNILE